MHRSTRAGGWVPDGPKGTESPRYRKAAKSATIRA